MANADNPEGWGWPSNSRKAHYFRDGRSLCRRWGWFSERLEQPAFSSPDDCAECTRRLAKERLTRPQE